MKNQLIQHKDKWYIQTETGYLEVIASTDPKLTPNGTTEFGAEQDILMMPQIPQSFIEEYCKAGGIDEVLVEYEEVIGGICDCPAKDGISARFDSTNRIYHHVECSVLSRITKPKLNPDNCIIIHPVGKDIRDTYDWSNNPLHPVEEKMYSREEVADKVKEAVIEITPTWYMSPFEQNEFLERIDKWIEENL